MKFCFSLYCPLALWLNSQGWTTVNIGDPYDVYPFNAPTPKLFFSLKSEHLEVFMALPPIFIIMSKSHERLDNI